MILMKLLSHLMFCILSLLFSPLALGYPHTRYETTKNSIEGIDLAEFECIYSPAKRRGPVPGKSGQTRKVGDAFPSKNSSGSGGGGAAANGGNAMDIDWQQQQQQQQPMMASSADISQQQMQQMMGAANQQMTLIQKLQQQQQQLGGAGAGAGGIAAGGLMAAAAAAASGMAPPEDMNMDSQQPLAQRIRREPGTADATEPGAIPKTVAVHTHLLERSDVEGNRLRAYYRLSIDELFRLPLTPSDEEYCAKWNTMHNTAATGGALMTPATIPGAHLAALSASRFAEIALGAVVHQEISLAMELCNAVVHCLRECVQEPVQDSYLYEVARAYFLLGVFRACRGDMERYFKYRRVAMTYAAKLPVSVFLFYSFLFSSFI